MKAFPRSFPVLTALSGVFICTQAGAQITTLVLTRQDAPETAPGIYYSDFGPPMVGGLNQAAFTAALEGPDVGTHNDLGIWDQSGATTVLVGREGFAAPGIEPSSTNTLLTNIGPGSVVLNSANQIAFAASLTGLGVGSHNDEGIWRGAPGAPALVVRKGEQAAGVPAGANFNGFSPPVLNAAGQLAFKARLTGLGIGTFNDEGLWAGAPGALVLVARKGSQAALEPAGPNYEVLGSPVLNDEGQVAFKSTLSGLGVGTFNNEALWAGTPGALRVVARKGTQDNGPGLGNQVTYSGFVTDPPAYNRANQVAFVASLSGVGIGAANNEGLWFGAPDAVVLVARKGNAAAGTPEGVDYNGFGPPAINGAGRIAFRGILTGAGVGSQNNQALWHGTPGALTLLARTADVAPGATPSGAMFSAFSDPLINEAGRVVFKATLTGVGVGGDNNDGIWAADSAGNVSKVLQEGDLIDIGAGDVRTINFIPGELHPGNGEDGRSRSLNAQDQLALNVGFLTGTNAIVVANLSPSAAITFTGWSLSGGNITLTWTGGGTLESSPLLGPGATWTSTGATGGSFTEAATGTKYYRVRQ